MRVYLEAREQVGLEVEPEFVRIDVTGKTSQEQSDILTSLKDFMSGITCIFSRHYCYHDDGKICASEVV